MKKNLHSRLVCILLALMLLMQNLAFPVHANEDGITLTCPECGSANMEYHAPVPATCTQIGWTAWYSCREPGCNGKYEPDKVGSLDHSYVTVDEVPATCTTAGTTAGTRCSVCGYVSEGLEPITAPGHSPQNVDEVPATCEADGTAAGKNCSVCGVVLEGLTPIPGGHIKQVTTEAKAPTCTADGCTEGWKCTRPGCTYEVKSEVIPAGHQLEKTADAKDATCTGDGQTEGWKCTREGCTYEVKSEVIPAGHLKEMTAEAKDPTCTEDGHTEGWYCVREGCTAKEDPETIPALGHDKLVTKEEQKPTCTAAGWTAAWYCQREGCTASEESKSLDALGHTPVTDEKVPASCTTDGKTEGSHCSVCGEVLEKQDPIPALNHKETETIDPSDSTCTQPGSTGGEKCLLCGEYLQKPEEIPALGHEKRVTAPARAATCTQDGCTEGWECAREGCGYTVASQVIPATGHTVVTDAGYAANCLRPGKTQGSHCSVCGTTLTYQYETPISTVHSIAPAQYLDPNASPLDYVCKVCGKTLTGLNGFKLQSFQESDLTSGNSGFQLSVGNGSAAQGSQENTAAEIASGKLQVYQDQDGNYVNILCLVAPDSTVSYISFEAGSSRIGDIFIVDSKNPDSGMIYAYAGLDISQLGIGIREDENGKQYLYVIEDGKEATFTVDTEVDENGVNSVVLNTENNSQVTIESSSIGYQVQSGEEGSQQTGNCLEIERTTAETTPAETTPANEPAPEPEPIVVEITFGIKYLDEPKEEPKQEPTEAPTEPQNSGGIQQISEPEKQENIEEQQDTGIMTIIPYVEKTEANNYVDSVEGSGGDDIQEGIETSLDPFDTYAYSGDVDYSKCHNWFSYSDEFDACAGCHKKLYHSYEQLDSKKHVCIRCTREREHSWYNSECFACDAVCKDHQWKSGERVCRYCTVCGLEDPHDWDGSHCKVCGYDCPHFWKSNHEEIHICSVCYQMRSHNYVLSSNSKSQHYCPTCGRNGFHVFSGSQCTICKYNCNHEWVKHTDDRYYCFKCYYYCMGDRHEWVNATGDNKCRCLTCPATREHDYSDGSGRCTRCGNACSHSFKNCKCTICGYQKRHAWRDGVCAACGTKCTHSSGWGYSTSTACRCLECGMWESHDWENTGGFYRKCTRCGLTTLRPIGKFKSILK